MKIREFQNFVELSTEKKKEKTIITNFSQYYIRAMESKNLKKIEKKK